jgi:1,2-diacylglycerol 3-alpha-glucosyltransferase
VLKILKKYLKKKRKRKSEKVKIAFFTETYLPNIDGVAVILSEIKKILEKNGHTVLIFCPKLDREHKEKNVFYFSSVPFPPYPSYRFAISFRGIGKILKEKRVDIIHSHGMGPMGLAAIYYSRTLNIPLVGTLHTNIQEATHYLFKSEKLKKFSKEIAWDYLRFYFNNCEFTTVPSKVIKEECKRNGIKNLIVIPYGINLDVFKKVKTSRDKTIKILYVGRLVREKNLDVVIKAARKIEREIKNRFNKETKFIIVGDGPAKGYYEDLTKKYKVDNLFEFVGFVKHEDTVKYYSGCDLFIFPSKFETLGLVSIEAMACGLPVVGARYLAIPEIVKDGYNGYLFDPDDPNDCYKKTILALNNKKKLEVGAKKTAKLYSIENKSKELLKLYELAINNRRKYIFSLLHL